MRIVAVIIVIALGAAGYYLLTPAGRELIDRAHNHLTRADHLARFRAGEILPGTPDLERFEQRLAAHGVSLGVPVFIRIFKLEWELELWVKKDGRFVRFATYPICKWSGRLGPKLGPLLFQLPPYFRADHPRLADFLAALPPGTEPAVEFRHESWLGDETYKILAQHRAALCIADAEDASTPPVPTAPFGYLRLRMPEYDAAALKSWLKRVQGQDWTDAFVFFKHEDEGKGPKLARRFLDLAAR